MKDNIKLGITAIIWLSVVIATYGNVNALIGFGLIAMTATAWIVVA